MGKAQKSQELTGAAHILAIPEVSTPQKVQRRRSEDEMNAALLRLMSGHPLPRDDDSPQVLKDAIAEVIVLRQNTMEMMQAIYSSYQSGLDRIREMTER